MNSNEKAVVTYYNTPESKRGYLLFLKGTKHFGYYKKGDKPWQFQKALRQMEDKLAKALDLPKNSKVLDAGCGMGDVASYLANNYGYHIDGIDLLDFNIVEAKKRIKERGLEKLINVQEMSYANLDFKNATFDGVYTMETFVHATDPAKTLKDFYKVLKPGGKLVMFEYSRDKDSEMTAGCQQAFKKVNELAAMPAFQQFTHGTLERMLADANFVDIKAKNIMHNIAPMLKVFNFVAYVPYKILCLLGKQDNHVNAMSAVEFYKYRKHIWYNIYIATKPN